VFGDDSEVEGDSWGSGDSYYGDRVGGEGLGDCQGRRITSQTTSLITSGILEYWNYGMMGKGHKP
jgi:hypothetical protein